MLPLQQLCLSSFLALRSLSPPPPPPLRLLKGLARLVTKAGGGEGEVAKRKEAGLGEARPEEKGRGKEAKTEPEIQGLDVAPKAKEIAPKVANPHVSQPASKKDTPPTKA